MYVLKTMFTKFDLHFASQNYCSNQCLHWLQQMSTGHLHCYRFESSLKKEISRNHLCDSCLFGPSYWIRTSGLLNPIQARYQTSPHPDICFCRWGVSPVDSHILSHASANVNTFFQKFSTFLSSQKSERNTPKCLLDTFPFLPFFPFQIVEFMI